MEKFVLVAWLEQAKSASGEQINYVGELKGCPNAAGFEDDELESVEVEALRAFVRHWREHFLTAMVPQHMPQGYVKYPLFLVSYLPFLDGKLKTLLDHPHGTQNMNDRKCFVVREKTLQRIPNLATAQNVNANKWK